MKKRYQPKESWYQTSLVTSKPEPYNLTHVSCSDISDASMWHAKWMQKYLLPEHIEEADLRKLCTLQMIHFMRYTEELERLLVSPVLNDVVNGCFDAAIAQDPVGMKSAAIRILTDEAYHASFSFDAYYDMLNKFDLSELGRTKKTEKIINKIQAGKEEDRLFRRMIVAVMSESNVTNDLARLSKSIKPGPFQDMILDHLHDERSHMLFFGHLFSMFWQSLDESQQVHYGRQIPELMREFYRKDAAWLAENCDAMGVSANLKINLQNYRHNNLIRIINDQAKPFFSLLNKNAVFENHQIAAHFNEQNFSYGFQ